MKQMVTVLCVLVLIMFASTAVMAGVEPSPFRVHLKTDVEKYVNPGASVSLSALLSSPLPSLVRRSKAATDAAIFVRSGRWQSETKQLKLSPNKKVKCKFSRKFNVHKSAKTGSKIAFQVYWRKSRKKALAVGKPVVLQVRALRKLKLTKNRLLQRGMDLIPKIEVYRDKDCNMLVKGSVACSSKTTLWALFTVRNVSLQKAGKFRSMAKIISGNLELAKEWLDCTEGLAPGKKITFPPVEFVVGNAKKIIDVHFTADAMDTVEETQMGEKNNKLVQRLKLLRYKRR